MKLKILFGFLVALTGIFLWTGCDKIEEPVIITSEQYSSDSYLDTLYFTDSVSITEKQVLLEDFTGHKCVNCPEAALAAHELAGSLNHRLVIYSVHADYYAEPDATGNYTADYRCATGEQLYDDFLVFSNPLALINRTAYNGSTLILAASWEAAVNIEIAKPNRVSMKLRNIWYPNLGKVQTDVYTTFLNQEDDLFNLVVFVVEDSIVSPQKNNNAAIGPTPDWLDYMHRNILRGSLNSTYGTEVSSDGSVVPNQEYHNQLIYTLDPEWETKNCRIIAYIINKGSNEVIQVAEAGIKVE